MGFSRQEYWGGLPFPSPGDLLNPGIKARSPALRVDPFPAEPQRKPKSTGVGSLSLLQRIFPTQELSQGLLHCTWILYPLSYEGSTTVSSVKLLSRVRLSAIPRTVAYQAPPSMEFSRQEYWSGLPFPSPGDLPDPGIEPRYPALRADPLPSEPPGKVTVS